MRYEKPPKTYQKYIVVFPSTKGATLCFRMNFHAKGVALEQENWVNLQQCFESLSDVEKGSVMARWKSI